MPVAPYLGHETVKKLMYRTVTNLFASVLPGPKARVESLSRQ